jgi:outer membrane biosynthesis protein TonB
MGLIKKAFGAIFGLIGTVLKGVLGIFGVGKKSEFFLELDESQDSEPAPKPAAEKQPKPEPAKTSEAPKAAPAQASKQQPAKPEPAESSKNGSAPKPQPATQSSGSPLSNPSGMAVASAKVDTKSAGNFSTEYLVNPKLSSGSRRRPGPSLSPFKDMAKQMQPSGR